MTTISSTIYHKHSDNAFQLAPSHVNPFNCKGCSKKSTQKTFSSALQFTIPITMPHFFKDNIKSEVICKGVVAISTYFVSWLNVGCATEEHLGV